jgi:uncharacterized protein YlxP (DUF503 family)
MGSASGYVGILSFELFFPESHSLKEKRMQVRSAKAQLQKRLGCAIAETDHHDVWQRSRLTLACVTRDAHDVDRLLDEAERWLVGNGLEPSARERRIVSLDDE